jgi:hypothetical protein
MLRDTMNVTLATSALRRQAGVPREHRGRQAGKQGKGRSLAPVE